MISFWTDSHVNVAHSMSGQQFLDDVGTPSSYLDLPLLYAGIQMSCPLSLMQLENNEKRDCYAKTLKFIFLSSR